MHTDMQLWTEVRHALFVEGISKREAVRRFGLNFRTISKIATQESPGEYERESSGRTKLAPYIPLIKDYLAEDKTLPPKQQHTPKRIYERLRDEHGYPFSDRAVRYVIAKLTRQAKPVFVPLAHPRGEAQFDFGFAQAVIGGVRRKIAYAAVSLPYSNVRYVRAYPKECTETFQDALKHFFLFLGGVPTLIKFDNSKVNVAKIVGGRGQEASRGLLELESAYFFKHHFCRVRQPQEKGHVENAVDYLRHNFMVPMPEFPDFRSFNESLEQKCRDEFSKTSKMQTKTIGELFSEERSALLPLCDTDFEARRTEQHTANSLSLIRFDRNDYSVPSQHAYKEFEVIGGIDTVRFVVDGEVVAVHERDWGVKGTHYNPLHYLAALRKRPNSLDFGAPFADWHLSKEFGVLRKRLESKAGSQGKREYIKILQLLERFTLDQLSRGIAKALSMSTTAYEAVRLCVETASETSVELFALDGRPLLQQVQLPEPRMDVYSTLLQEKHDEENRNEIDGAVEASFETTEAAEHRAGLRGSSVSLCEGERRPPRLPAPIIGTGIGGSGSEGGGKTTEVGKVSELENAGELRFQGPAVDQQDARESIDAGRVHPESGVHHPDRPAGNGQDAPGDRVGHEGLPDGKESEILPRQRPDRPDARSPGGEDVDADEEEPLAS